MNMRSSPAVSPASFLRRSLVGGFFVHGAARNIEDWEYKTHKASPLDPAGCGGYDQGDKRDDAENNTGRNEKICFLRIAGPVQAYDADNKLKDAMRSRPPKAESAIPPNADSAAEPATPSRDTTVAIAPNIIKRMLTVFKSPLPGAFILKPLSRRDLTRRIVSLAQFINNIL